MGLLRDSGVKLCSAKSRSSGTRSSFMRITRDARDQMLSVGLRRTRSTSVVVGLANEVEGLGVLGFCDSFSDVRIGEVQDTQGAILHPRDRFDTVEGLAVLALFTVGDVYVSLCKKGAYALFSAQRRSRALFWL